MGTKFWLTDEDADIAGYKRAKADARSDACSLVRAVTNTALGPTSIGITRKAAATTTLKWITDPLDGPAIDNTTWSLRVWASEDSLLANAALQLQVSRFTPAGELTPFLTSNTAELTTTIRDVGTTTSAPTPATLDLQDRLVFTFLVVDAVATTMATGYTVTFSYNGLYGGAEGDSYVVCPAEIVIANEIPLETLQSLRRTLRDLGDTNPQFDDNDLIGYLYQALRTYSVDRPRVVAYYYSGDGTTYDFPLPSKWINGFSRVVGIEFPANEQIPSVFETIDYELRESVLGVQPVQFIRFRVNVPESGTNNVQLFYTTHHEFSSEYSTIPANDLDAVLWLAASYAASALSARGAGSIDSSMSADVVNYRDASSKWASVAKMLKDMYLNRVVSPDSASPVGSTENWDSALSFGFPYLWHNRRIRRVRSW